MFGRIFDTAADNATDETTEANPQDSLPSPTQSPNSSNHSSPALSPSNLNTPSRLSSSISSSASSPSVSPLILPRSADEKHTPLPVELHSVNTMFFDDRKSRVSISRNDIFSRGATMSSSTLSTQDSTVPKPTMGTLTNETNSANEKEGASCWSCLRR